MLARMADGPNPVDLMPAYADALPLDVARDILAVSTELHRVYRHCFRTQAQLDVSLRAVAEATAAIADFTRQIIEAK
ncbi:hypothetical protein ACH4U6_20710 [Streptomyces netropsis]|uniref:hypothetical protein n=1 Tax=Streptomyces netropsis TaxID=55404 RepID=UPI0037A55D74